MLVLSNTHHHFSLGNICGECLNNVQILCQGIRLINVAISVNEGAYFLKSPLMMIWDQLSP